MRDARPRNALDYHEPIKYLLTPAQVALYPRRAVRHAFLRGPQGEGQEERVMNAKRARLPRKPLC